MSGRSERCLAASPAAGASQRAPPREATPSPTAARSAKSSRFRLVSSRRTKARLKREASFGGLRGELPRVDPELLQKLGVLLVVDLVGQLLHRLLNLPALPLLAKFVKHELLVEFACKLLSVGSSSWGWP